MPSISPLVERKSNHGVKGRDVVAEAPIAAGGSAGEVLLHSCVLLEIDPISIAASAADSSIQHANGQRSALDSVFDGRLICRLPESTNVTPNLQQFVYPAKIRPRARKPSPISSFHSFVLVCVEHSVSGVAEDAWVQTQQDGSRLYAYALTVWGSTLHRQNEHLTRHVLACSTLCGPLTLSRCSGDVR